MQVDVNITRKDLVRINLFLWPRSKWTWIYMYGLFALCMAVAIINMEGFSAAYLGIMVLITASIAVVFSFLAFALCLSINIAAASPRTGLGAHHYRLEEEGLRESTDINEELSKWKSFDRLWKSRNYIVLKKHWAAIHIFPARCFDSRAQFDEFHAVIAAKISSGKPVA